MDSHAPDPLEHAVSTVAIVPYGASQNDSATRSDSAVFLDGRIVKVGAYVNAAYALAAAESAVKILACRPIHIGSGSDIDSAGVAADAADSDARTTAPLESTICAGRSALDTVAFSEGADSDGCIHAGPARTSQARAAILNAMTDVNFNDPADVEGIDAAAGLHELDATINQLELTGGASGGAIGSSRTFPAFAAGDNEPDGIVLLLLTQEAAGGTLGPAHNADSSDPGPEACPLLDDDLSATVEDFHVTDAIMMLSFQADVLEEVDPLYHAPQLDSCHARRSVRVDAVDDADDADAQSGSKLVRSNEGSDVDEGDVEDYTSEEGEDNPGPESGEDEDGGCEQEDVSGFQVPETHSLHKYSIPSAVLASGLAATAVYPEIDDCARVPMAVTLVSLADCAQQCNFAYTDESDEQCNNAEQFTAQNSMLYALYYNAHAASAESAVAAAAFCGGRTLEGCNERTVELSQVANSEDASPMQVQKQMCLQVCRTLRGAAPWRSIETCLDAAAISQSLRLMRALPNLLYTLGERWGKTPPLPALPALPVASVPAIVIPASMLLDATFAAPAGAGDIQSSEPIEAPLPCSNLLSGPRASLQAAFDAEAACMKLDGFSEISESASSRADTAAACNPKPLLTVGWRLQDVLIFADGSLRIETPATIKPSSIDYPPASSIIGQARWHMQYMKWQGRLFAKRLGFEFKDLSALLSPDALTCMPTSLFKQMVARLLCFIIDVRNRVFTINTGYERLPWYREPVLAEAGAIAVPLLPAASPLVPSSTMTTPAAARVAVFRKLAKFLSRRLLEKRKLRFAVVSKRDAKARRIDRKRLASRTFCAGVVLSSEKNAVGDVVPTAAELETRLERFRRAQQERIPAAAVAAAPVSKTSYSSVKPSGGARTGRNQAAVPATVYRSIAHNAVVVSDTFLGEVQDVDGPDFSFFPAAASLDLVEMDDKESEVCPSNDITGIPPAAATAHAASSSCKSVTPPTSLAAMASLEQQRCTVCALRREWPTVCSSAVNDMVLFKCAECHTHVHARCYGLPVWSKLVASQAAAGQWHCELCQDFEAAHTAHEFSSCALNNPPISSVATRSNPDPDSLVPLAVVECELCRNGFSGIAMKRTAAKGYAHVICVAFARFVRFSFGGRLMLQLPDTSLTLSMHRQIAQGRKCSTCSCCGKLVLFTCDVQCAGEETSCGIMHPSCALQAGLLQVTHFTSAGQMDTAGVSLPVHAANAEAAADGTKRKSSVASHLVDRSPQAAPSPYWNVSSAVPPPHLLDAVRNEDPALATAIKSFLAGLCSGDWSLCSANLAANGGSQAAVSCAAINSLDLDAVENAGAGGSAMPLVPLVSLGPASRQLICACFCDADLPDRQRCTPIVADAASSLPQQPQQQHNPSISLMLAMKNFGVSPIAQQILEKGVSAGLHKSGGYKRANYNNATANIALNEQFLLRSRPGITPARARAASLYLGHIEVAEVFTAVCANAPSSSSAAGVEDESAAIAVALLSAQCGPATLSSSASSASASFDSFHFPTLLAGLQRYVASTTLACAAMSTDALRNRANKSSFLLPLLFTARARCTRHSAVGPYASCCIPFDVSRLVVGSAAGTCAGRVVPFWWRGGLSMRVSFQAALATAASPAESSVSSSADIRRAKALQFLIPLQMPALATCSAIGELDLGAAAGSFDVATSGQGVVVPADTAPWVAGAKSRVAEKWSKVEAKLSTLDALDVGHKNRCLTTFLHSLATWVADVHTGANFEGAPGSSAAAMSISTVPVSYRITLSAQHSAVVRSSMPRPCRLEDLLPLETLTLEAPSAAMGLGILSSTKPTNKAAVTAGTSSGKKKNVAFSTITEPEELVSGVKRNVNGSSIPSSISMPVVSGAVTFPSTLAADRFAIDPTVSKTSVHSEAEQAAARRQAKRDRDNKRRREARAAAAAGGSVAATASEAAAGSPSNPDSAAVSDSAAVVCSNIHIHDVSAASETTSVVTDAILRAQAKRDRDNRRRREARAAAAAATANPTSEAATTSPSNPHFVDVSGNAAVACLSTQEVSAAVATVALAADEATEAILNTTGAVTDSVLRAQAKRNRDNQRKRDARAAAKVSLLVTPQAGLITPGSEAAAFTATAVSAQSIGISERLVYSELSLVRAMPSVIAADGKAKVSALAHRALSTGGTAWPGGAGSLVLVDMPGSPLWPAMVVTPHVLEAAAMAPSLVATARSVLSAHAGSAKAADPLGGVLVYFFGSGASGLYAAKVDKVQAFHAVNAGADAEADIAASGQRKAVKRSSKKLDPRLREAFADATFVQSCRSRFDVVEGAAAAGSSRAAAVACWVPVVGESVKVLLETGRWLQNQSVLAVIASPPGNSGSGGAVGAAQPGAGAAGCIEPSATGAVGDDTAVSGKKRKPSALPTSFSAVGDSAAPQSRLLAAVARVLVGEPGAASVSTGTWVPLPTGLSYLWRVLPADYAAVVPSSFNANSSSSMNPPSSCVAADADISMLPESTSLAAGVSAPATEICSSDTAEELSSIPHPHEHAPDSLQAAAAAHSDVSFPSPAALPVQQGFSCEPAAAEAGAPLSAKRSRRGDGHAEFYSML